MIVKDVKTILDPGRVESLLHQLCLHLLESPCHLQSILIERKVQIIQKKKKVKCHPQGELHCALCDQLPVSWWSGAWRTRGGSSGRAYTLALHWNRPLLSQWRPPSRSAPRALRCHAEVKGKRKMMHRETMDEVQEVCRQMTHYPELWLHKRWLPGDTRWLSGCQTPPLLPRSLLSTCKRKRLIKFIQPKKKGALHCQIIFCLWFSFFQILFNTQKDHDQGQICLQKRILLLLFYILLPSPHFPHETILVLTENVSFVWLCMFYWVSLIACDKILAINLQI